MREAKIYQRDQLVGTLEVPDSWRPPMSEAELSRIPAKLIAQSRSWLFDVRATDFRLELRGEGRDQEVVVIAHPSIAPNDFGCIVGFRAGAGRERLHDATEGRERLHDATEMISLADEVLANHEGKPI
jgi:hypothetical protein